MPSEAAGLVYFWLVPISTFQLKHFAEIRLRTIKPILSNIY